MNQKISAIILAAGKGERMGKKINKPYLKIDQKPILIYSLEKFAQSPLIREIVVVINENDVDRYDKLLTLYDFDKPIKQVYGGQKRQDSCSQGVKATDEKSDLILVHDGARPFFSKKLVRELIKAAVEYGGAAPGLSIKDTIREKSDHGLVGKTLDRKRLFRMQTPQCFEREILIDALERAIKEDKYFTDEAGLVYQMGKVKVKAYLIPGEERNIKITSPFDLKLAELIASG